MIPGDLDLLDVKINATLEKFDNETGKLVETIYIEDGQIVKIIKED